MTTSHAVYQSEKVLVQELVEKQKEEKKNQQQKPQNASSLFTRWIITHWEPDKH